ncbi:recombinase family protein [Pyrobaculum sp. 3827-6]|uniref:recombinase family protein n=1 Tax=Pyrobaculum sp. 3827-6 TaxID=2983604 RepID=UPI0021D9B514|nr:recombinase family protein [Pyrobaculum sp. 3827-6]MCU7787163.1 recombinase family protein [Pyrobaculum sp. 3827-6]
MDVVAYVRVSQEEERPENQEFAIYQWAAKQGHRIVEVYRDVGVSGATSPQERPGWRQVLESLANGRAQGVVVYALDRVARSLWELAAVYKQFSEKGWALYSVREEWLTSVDPKVRDLLVAVLGWAGEMEREFIRERTREALRRLRAEGKRLGRPPKWSPQVKARIVDLVRRGLTLREAVKLVGIGYRTAVRYLSRDPDYLEAVRVARLTGARRATK